jgi:hypothetical protein
MAKIEINGKKYLQVEEIMKRLHKGQPSRPGSKML